MMEMPLQRNEYHKLNLSPCLEQYPVIVSYLLDSPVKAHDMKLFIFYFPIGICIGVIYVGVCDIQQLYLVCVNALHTSDDLEVKGRQQRVLIYELMPMATSNVMTSFHNTKRTQRVVMNKPFV